MADGSGSIGSSNFSIDSVHFYEEEDFFTELDDNVDAGELPTGCYLGIRPFGGSPRVSCRIYPSRGAKPRVRDISDTIPEGYPGRKGLANTVINQISH